MPTRLWTPALDLPGFLGEFHSHFDGQSVGATGLGSSWGARAGSLTAIQNTAANRPTRVANALAGKSVWDFGGTMQTFVLSGLGGVVPRYVASVAWMRDVTTAGRQAIVCAWNGSNVGHWLHDGSGASAAMRHIVAESTSSFHTAAAGSTQNTTDYLIRTGGLEGRRTLAWLNGVQGNLESTLNNFPGTTTTPVVIAGRAGGVSGSTSTRIANLVFCSLLPSQANREKLDGYLAHEWQLTHLLAADHPHKTLRPTVEVPGLGVWNGSTWSGGLLKRWDGTTWIEGQLKVWNGSQWINS